MVDVHIQLTDEQAARLRAAAAARGVPVARVLRDAVDALASDGAPSDDQRRRALAAAGAIYDPSPAVGENHDDYLPRAFER